MKRLIIIFCIMFMTSGCSIGDFKLNNSNKNWQAKVSVKEKNEDNIDINMPVVSDIKNDMIQKQVNNLIKNKVDRIKYEIKNSASSENNNDSIDCNIQYNNNGILSLSFKYKYLKSEKTDSITINTRTGMELYLKDIFNDNEDYKKIIMDSIKNQVNADKNKYNLSFYEELDSAHYDQNFYIDGSNVYIYFNQESKTDLFKIPYSTFKYGIIKSADSKAVAYALSNEIIDYKGSITVGVFYPQLDGTKYKSVNNKLKVDCMKYIDEIKNSAKGSTEPNSNRKYGVSIDYKIPYNKGNLISILQNFHSYTGGDSEIAYLHSTNVNIKTGKVVMLGDLFKKDYDYKTVINDEVKKQIKERENLLLYDTFEKFSGITDDIEYYIEKDSLVIFFQTHELKPDALEKIKFRIPLSQFGDNVKLNK